MSQRPKSDRRRTPGLSRRLCFALIAGLLVVSIAGVWYGRQWLPTAAMLAPPDGFQGDRALWMGVEWSMEPRADEELQRLANELRAHAITDAFVYVSYLKATDEFNPTYSHASEFVRRMRALYPDARLWAWVGVPIQITTPDRQQVVNRLEDPDIRAKIAAFGNDVVADLGFDGIHLNAELIANGDPAYLDTLREIRAALPEGAKLSVAPHALRLTQAVTSLPYPTIRHHWTADYLLRVALEVDQVAIMLYDSGLINPQDYRAWTAYQVRAIASALAGIDTHILVGLPTSEEWTPSHHAGVETLANALQALMEGLAQAEMPNTIDGIAIYPHWEMSADEWLLVDALPR